MVKTDHIHWMGHDCFRIEAEGKTIYIDPYQLADDAPKADIILVTHSHFDHYSEEDVKKVAKSDTALVSIADVVEQRDMEHSHVVAPGDSVEVDDITVHAVASYNVNKFRSPGEPFHPKESGFVGFIIEAGGQTIYHAGDTDVIPEMEDLPEIDVALIPVSGKYVMTAEEAVEAAAIIGPKVAIPMHYGAVAGNEADAEKFKREFTGEVVIKEKE
jgi:L-ascorbate metabolism protein UlaG (beta-lactamase superfamily)